MMPLGIFTNSPRLGPVAGRTFLPNEFNSTNTWVKSETNHMLMDDIDGEIEFWWPNFYATNANGEATPGADATGTAQVTYIDRSGATQVANLYDRLNGTTALFAPDGGLFKAFAPIRSFLGRRVYPRIRANLPNGMVYSQWQADIPNGDLFEFGTSAPSSLDVAPVNSFASNLALYAPCAILARTRRETAVILSDSRDSGLGDRPNDSYGHIGQFARLIGRRMGYINLSIPGDTAQSFADSVTKSPRRTAIAKQFGTYKFIGFGFNDIVRNGRSPAQAEADNLTIAANVGGSVVIKTIDPATTNGSTNTSDNLEDTDRATYNGWARPAPAPFVAAYDPDSVLENATTPGIWASLSYVSSDGTHESNTGNAFAAANAGFDFSRIGSPALYTIPAFAMTDLGGNLAAWHRPSTATVSSWPDSSANARDFTQATGANQPLVSPNGGLRFDTAAKRMVSALSASDNDAIMFAVITIPAFGGTRTILGSSANGGRQFRVGSAGRLEVNSQSTASYADSGSNLVAAARKCIVAFRTAGASSKFSIDGGTEFANASAVTFGAGLTTVLGAAGAGTEPFYNATGGFADIHEIVVTEATITTADYNKVIGRLAWDHGVQSFLPSGHPYKTAAP